MTHPEDDRRDRDDASEHEHDGEPGARGGGDKDTPPGAPGDSDTPLGDTDQHSDAY